MDAKVAAPSPAPVTPPAPSAELAEAIKPADRARACGKELEAVLAKHGCSIAPFLRPLEPVGHAGDRALVQASYAIIPNQ